MTQLESIRKRKIEISKGMAHKVIKDFCESTSLHGYSYLYIAETIISKLVWTLVILFMTGLGMFLLVKNTNDYIKARLVTNVESSYANLSVRIFFCHIKSGDTYVHIFKILSSMWYFHL